MVKPSPSDKIINKGSAVKADKWKLVAVRMPKRLIDEIDEVRKKKLGLSRNVWILEAIQEKLKAED